MKLAPEVNRFIRNREYERPEQTTLQKGADILGKAALIGGTLAAAHAIGGGFSGRVAGNVGKAAEAAGLAKLGRDFGVSGDSPPLGNVDLDSPSGGGFLSNVDLGGPVETSSTPSDRGFFSRARARRGANTALADKRRNYRQRSGSGVEQSSQGTSDEFITDIWGDESSQQTTNRGNVKSGRQSAVDNVVSSLVKSAPSEVIEKVEPAEQVNVEIVDRPLANIRRSWSTDVGGRRFAPGGRDVVNESEWKPGSWQTEKTEKSIWNPLGIRLVKKPIVVGKNPDGSDKYMQPKAALTGGDRSLIPRQWPPAGRVNVGDAYASMMSGPGMSGLGPFFDGLTAHFGPLGDIHVPGALQLANWGVPVVAGLGRKGLGDAMEVADLAASGAGYVAKNLRPILQQGKYDWSKGIRDARTGIQDLDLVKDTTKQLMLAAAMKRDRDLGLIEGGAQRVMTWAQKQRSLEGRPLAGSGQLSAGDDSQLVQDYQLQPEGDNTQPKVPSRAIHSSDSVIDRRVAEAKDFLRNRVASQQFEAGEGWKQSESIASLGIGEDQDNSGLLQVEFHKTPGKVYSFYDEQKRHPLVKESSNILGGVMKGRRRNTGSGPMTGTVQIPSSLEDQYYEEMDERLTQAAQETDSAAYLEDQLRRNNVSTADSFTAGGLVNALKKGGRQGFQEYVQRAAGLERLDEEGRDAYKEKGGKYPRGWWGS